MLRDSTEALPDLFFSSQSIIGLFDPWVLNTFQGPSPSCIYRPAYSLYSIFLYLTQQGCTIFKFINSCTTNSRFMRENMMMVGIKIRMIRNLQSFFKILPFTFFNNAKLNCMQYHVYSKNKAIIEKSSNCNGISVSDQTGTTRSRIPSINSRKASSNLMMKTLPSYP